MNRRTALRNVVLLSAGAALLPSCAGNTNDKDTYIPLKNLQLTNSQREMMDQLSEAIIPKTKDFVGAHEMRAANHVLSMVDGYHNPEEQKAFLDGMQEFENACKQKWAHSFITCSPQQKKEFLQDAEDKRNLTEGSLKFYQLTKRYTIQCFTSSEKYMTDIRHYKMVPGPNYKGCVAV